MQARPLIQKEELKVEIYQILHMAGSQGEASYACNSTVQGNAIHKAKSVVQESISQTYCTLQPDSLVIADLGCSYGPTVFMVISEIMDAICDICNQLNRRQPELVFFLNDLPSNDFNAIFKSLAGYEMKVQEEKGNKHPPYYIFGAPGSFYGRLFPSRSVHFMHSSYSLHWLSQVPHGLKDDRGTPINKGSIYIDCRSAPTVFESYQAQFQQDFSKFLELRAKEIASRGYLVMTLMGRSNMNPVDSEISQMLGLLAKAFNDLVVEGIVEEEKVNMFDLPVYATSMEEVKAIVLSEGSFEFYQSQTFVTNWDPFDDCMDNFVKDCHISGSNTAKSIRAVLGPLISSHFGEVILDTLFSRYAIYVAEHLNKQKTKYINLIVSLKKKT